jgi:hypothetical protein
VLVKLRLSVYMFLGCVLPPPLVRRKLVQTRDVRGAKRRKPKQRGDGEGEGYGWAWALLYVQSDPQRENRMGVKGRRK